MKSGRLEWIGVRPARREPVVAVERAVLDPGRGIVGDHYRRKRGPSREVTLIQHEHFAEIAAALEREQVEPELFRRNLAISGIDLLRVKGRLRIGGAVLEITGPCAPCARMDEALGPRGRRAMSGKGGVTAAIVTGGEICLGDTVEPLAD